MRKLMTLALGATLLSLPAVSIQQANAQLVTRENQGTYATGSLKREKHVTKGKTQSASKKKAKKAAKK
jgi:hypothetical protein